MICPSNPLISVAPILAVEGLRAALERAQAPLVAISPLVGGRALKGPAAKMMAELGLGSDALAIARFYAGLIDGLIIDTRMRTRRGRSRRWAFGRWWRRP